MGPQLIKKRGKGTGLDGNRVCAGQSHLITKEEEKLCISLS